MVKEAKNIDLITTGKQPSVQDFARISEWILKKKQTSSRPKKQAPKQKKLAFI